MRTLAASDPDPGARRAVLLLSGGLDSYTAGAIARQDGFALHALTVRYGQTHDREIACARLVAADLGVAEHVELSMDLGRIAASALTGAGPVPHDGLPAGGGRIPVTYVPARNTILLALALAWAETLDARDLVIGVNAVDYSGYPDCRPEFIEGFERLSRLATRAGVEGTAFRVRAPLLRLTKGEIIRCGLELGLDYGLTNSCYEPLADGRPCGTCDACVLRARGFADAGAIDPLVAARTVEGRSTP